MSGFIGVILGMLVFILFIQLCVVTWMGILTFLKRRSRQQQLEY